MKLKRKLSCQWRDISRQGQSGERWIQFYFGCFQNGGFSKIWCSFGELEFLGQTVGENTHSQNSRLQKSQHTQGVTGQEFFKSEGFGEEREIIWSIEEDGVVIRWGSKEMEKGVMRKMWIQWVEAIPWSSLSLMRCLPCLLFDEAKWLLRNLISIIPKQFRKVLKTFF